MEMAAGIKNLGELAFEPKSKRFLTNGKKFLFNFFISYPLLCNY